jgi:preprotein translocase subunit SecF
MGYFSLILAVALVFNSIADQVTAAPENKEAQTRSAAQGSKIRSEVEKRGAGKQSQVKVKLKNNTDVRGYISKIGDTSFEVTGKSGQATTIEYANVQKLQGSGLSKGAKIGIIVGVVVVAVAIVIAVAVAKAGAPTFRGGCCLP